LQVSRGEWRKQRSNTLGEQNQAAQITLLLPRAIKMITPATCLKKIHAAHQHQHTAENLLQLLTIISFGNKTQ